MATPDQCDIQEAVYTHQWEGFPQDSANGTHAMGDFKSVMNQMFQKQAHEMEAVCSKFQEEKNGTIMRLRADVKNLRRLLRQRETSLSSLRKENQEKTAEIDELKVVQDNLKAEEGRLNNVVCKMHKANKDLNDEWQEKWRSERREREIQGQKVAILSSRHDAEIQKLRKEKMKELEIAARDNQELRHSLAEQRRMHGACEERMDKLKTELMACHVQMRGLKQRLQKGLEQGEAVRRENQTLNDTLKEERKKNEELKVKLQGHTVSIFDLMRERNLLQDQIKELKETVQKETQKTATLEEDLVQVLQQFQGVGRHALGLHSQLLQDLMPRAPDVVKAVSDEGNTVDADTHQVFMEPSETTNHSAQLTNSRFHECPQLPANLPEVTMQILVYFTPQMGRKWKFLAYALGVKEQATLLADSPEAADSKCLTVLQTWIDQGPDVTWKNLIDALWGLGLRSTAIAVCENLNQMVDVIEQ